MNLVPEKNYINGKWTYDTGLPYFISRNPSTGEEIGMYPNSETHEVQEAVSAARVAQKDWRRLSRIARGEYFDKLADVVKSRFNDLVSAISLETGKSINESIAEVNESLHMIQYTFSQSREQIGKLVASEIAEKDIVTLRKPKGVVAVISPWNFPLAICFWNSGPALLEGNTVVFKPSEETPKVGRLIAELYEQAGFPPGVFNLVHGEGAITGVALVDANVDHICFTGSAEVGRYIRGECNETWKKTCSCEMGGKSAVVVFEDANIDMAVNAAVTSAFRLSGQRCVSAGRILIQRKIFDAFVGKFLSETYNQTIGDPFNSPKPNFGPLINESQLKRVLRYNEMTKNAPRVNVLLEGKKIDGPGYFVTPHVYTSEWFANDKENTYAFLREEVFGPHVALIPFDTLEDAVRIYNDTDYGLSISVCTNNMFTARYMRDNCDFGLGYVNLPCIGAESHCEFGGIKKSGYGGSSAAGSFAAVTHSVTWTTNYDPSGFSMAQGLK